MDIDIDTGADINKVYFLDIVTDMILNIDKDKDVDLDLDRVLDLDLGLHLDLS